MQQNLPPPFRDMIEGSDLYWARKEEDMRTFWCDVGRAAVHGDPQPRSETPAYRDFVRQGMLRGFFRLGLKRREKMKLFFVMRRTTC